MKKNLFPLIVLGIIALLFLASCSTPARCDAYRDSRANTHTTISQYHSRG